MSKVNAIEQVQTALNDEAKKMRTITPDDLRDTIKNISERIDTFCSAFNTLPDSDQELLQKKIVAQPKDAPFATIYNEITYAVNARGINTRGFALFLRALNVYKGLVGYVNMNIDVIFQRKKTTIYNTRVSHVAALAIVDQARRLIDYTFYLWDGVMYDSIGNKETAKPPQYRLDYLLKYKELVIGLLKNATHGDGGRTILNELKNVTKNDIELVDDQNKPNAMINRITVGGLIMGGFSILTSIFRYFGEIGILARNAQYKKALKEREWMMVHVARLMLDLSGVDPDSPKYRSQVKIIDSYNQMLAQLDKEIAAYEDKVA